MNKELKHLLTISLTFLGIFIVIYNANVYCTTDFATQATKMSQICSQNRLRTPNVHRASERWTYPPLKHATVKLVASKRQQKVLVINRENSRVIYIIHAQINAPAQKGSLQVLQARGQQIYHVNGSRQATASNWLGISQGYYIETPVTNLDHEKVPRDLHHAPKINNTIQVSAPDAKWLQQLPANTPIQIKEDF